MNQPPGLPPPGGRTQAAAGQQHLPRMGGTSPAPPPGLAPSASNQSTQQGHASSATSSSLPPPPPGLQLPLPGIAQLQGVTPTASPPPPGLGAVGMGMAGNNGHGNNGMNQTNGHGHMGVPPQYQHNLQHSASPQPTLGASGATSQTQNVPAPQPSVDGANVSRAQVSFLINGLQEDSWERQLGEIRNVSRLNTQGTQFNLVSSSSHRTRQKSTTTFFDGSLVPRNPSSRRCSSKHPAWCLHQQRHSHGFIPIVRSTGR